MTSTLEQAKEQVERQSLIRIRTQLWDRIYSMARQLIVTKSADGKKNYTTGEAIKEITNNPQMLNQIKQDMFNNALDNAEKSDPSMGRILAEKFRSKDENTKQEGMKMLDMMIKKWNRVINNNNTVETSRDTLRL